MPCNRRFGSSHFYIIFMGMQMRKITGLIAALLSLNASATVSVLGAMEPNDSCRAGHKCEIHAMHVIYIINETNQPQTYKYVYMLQTKESSGVDYTIATVTIQPHKQWNNSKKTTINPYFEYAGLKDVRVETQVAGAENAIFDVNFKVDVRK
jgi:hypothetical protein